MSRPNGARGLRLARATESAGSEKANRPLLVVNPAACGGKTGRVFDQLLRPVERALGPVDVVFTTAPGDATRLAAEGALAGHERIVAVGGDGTFNEVCAGVLESGVRSAVGLIHQGTGGDFRRSLGLEHRLDRYLESIASGRRRAIDVGRVSFMTEDGEERTRTFVNVISLGMGGLVDRYVSDGPRGLGGKAAYFVASLRALATGDAGRLLLRIDGEEEPRRLVTRNLSICNGQWFGGGMQVAPDASLDDGRFDVVALTGADRLPVLTLAGAIYDGKHLSRPNMVHLRCSEIEITHETGDECSRFLLDVDGECVGRAPLRVTMLPRALDVLA